MKINWKKVLNVALVIAVPTVIVVGYVAYKHFTKGDVTAEQKEKRIINFIRKA